MSKQKSKYDEDLLALINQEWELVLRGKSSSKLSQLLRDYEMSLMTSALYKYPQLLEKYIYSLLMEGDFLELRFLLERCGQISHRQKVLQIAQLGEREKLKELVHAIKSFISALENKTIVKRIQQSTILIILNILGKYFINYSCIQLNKIIEVTENDLKKQGFKVQEGYVMLEKKENNEDCLMQKLKELTHVANKMSSFE